MPRNKSSLKQKTKGFTIIEVVLVLAIAGLIFMMVFVALPALQSSQRDTQRKNDLDRFRTAVETFRKNNKGKIPWKDTEGAPAISEKFVMRYVDTDAEDYKVNPNIVGPGSGCTKAFTSPSGNCYGVTVVSVGGYLGDKFNVMDILASDEYKDIKDDIVDTFLISPHSICGDIEGEIETARPNDLAVLTYLETGSMSCAD